MNCIVLGLLLAAFSILIGLQICYELEEDNDLTNEEYEEMFQMMDLFGGEDEITK